MSPVSVTRITPPAVAFPVTAFVGVAAGAVVGSGGLAWFGGRCWLWFGAQPGDGAPGYPVHVVRWARRMLSKAQQLGETEVFVFRDGQEASSARLLALLGFQFVGIEHEKELFKWQV